MSHEDGQQQRLVVLDWPGGPGGGRGQENRAMDDTPTCGGLGATRIPATDRQRPDLVDLGEIRLALWVRPTGGDDGGDGDGVQGHVSR